MSSQKRLRSSSPSPPMENGQLTATQPIQSIDNMNTTPALLPAHFRTLFVSGLPMDAKPRELYLLFVGCPGYESSKLEIPYKNGKPNIPVGFVTFSTEAEADEARKALQGVRFDPDTAHMINLELPRSNTIVSQPNQLSPPVLTNVPSTISQTVLQPDSAHQFATPPPPPYPHDLTATAYLQPYMVPFISDPQLLSLLPQFVQPPLLFPAASYGLHMPSLATSAAPALFQPNALAQAPAQLSAAVSSSETCSTLFVANLGQFVNREELEQAFRSFPGFHRLRMEKGTSMAFVEYADVQKATQAMNALQGVKISNSDGICIEYAKRKRVWSGRSRGAPPCWRDFSQRTAGTSL